MRTRLDTGMDGMATGMDGIKLFPSPLAQCFLESPAFTMRGAFSCKSECRRSWRLGQLKKERKRPPVTLVTATQPIRRVLCH